MPFVFFENVISNVVLQVHGSWFCMFSQWVFAARNLTSNIKQLSPWFCMPSTSYYLRTGSSLHLIEAQYESKHSFSGSGASTSSWRSSKIGHYWHTHTHTHTHTHKKKSHVTPMSQWTDLFDKNHMLMMLISSSSCDLQAPAYPPDLGWPWPGNTTVSQRWKPWWRLEISQQIHISLASLG